MILNYLIVIMMLKSLFECLFCLFKYRGFRFFYLRFLKKREGEKRFYYLREIEIIINESCL